MKLIIDIPEYVYERIREYYEKNDTVESTYSYIYHGTPIPDNATPCDFCRYNPPSSTDGKPCCMCPATPYQKGGKDEVN